MIDNMEELDRRIRINGIDSDYRLVFYSNGINRFQTAEEAIEQLLQSVSADNVEEIEEIKSMDYDDFEQISYAVYKGDDGNILIFEGYSFEDEISDERAIPKISNMIEFVIECLEKPLKENNHLIIYVSQTYGTTLDYDLVFDEVLYKQINETDIYSMIPGEVLSYICNAKEKSKDSCYKYGVIKNGKYSRLN